MMSLLFSYQLVVLIAITKMGIDLCLGGAVVSTDASEQEGPESDSSLRPSFICYTVAQKGPHVKN